MPHGEFEQEKIKNINLQAEDQNLTQNQRFVIDTKIEQKLLLTVAPSGFLLCVED
ncbi:hypothetical protein [Cohnella herbarum]|uniref:Uncharacterized protein n=1 Tax=Cohnella herbarum TaxID=2728023 RepID=A0A7Z2VLW4_9BACL|nr:hypothetical protein [Cohnella herbarum]QJD85215.1 hypothetical protein HH215_19910 [Cohnella herbarum]